jgi:phytoene dehydrogenase-like protein
MDRMSIWASYSKDVLGHISAWEETFLEPLRRYADGDPFQVEVIQGDLAWNDEQAARKQDTPLDVVVAELTSVRQGLVAAAGRLSAEQWKGEVPYPWGGQGTVAQALDGLGQHELEHVHAIQQWRGD